MATDAPQRIYRAACPACGAPVEFRSAQSVFAVCSFCKTTVVRDGDTLARVGKVADVFDDHSPLQLMASGKWNGKGFTLVGRLQYRSPDGPWTEWIASFDDGTAGVLGEDNGAYVFSLPADIGRDAPVPAQLRVGQVTAVAGVPYTIASNEQVALVSAQGELPKLPPLAAPFAMVELRSSEGEVLSIDYGSQPPAVSRGRAVLLDDLALRGLRDDPLARDDKGRQFSCPNCGAPVQVSLATSKSITCPSCKSIIDLSQGIGAQMQHVAQEEAIEPLIPLGTLGQLQGVQWQVVGYQHRMGHEPGDEDEQFGWDEYLLFNAKRGFTFLVDAQDGWSVVKPTTGAPSLSPNGQSAVYLGTGYALQETYEAQTTYVAGEFYWPVERGQKTSNRDFAKGASLLSMEQTPREVTWSGGTRIASDTVAQAFKLQDKKELLKRTDASPASAAKGIGCMTIIVLFIVILILLALLKACVDDERGGTGSSGFNRTGGGSFGGSSGGGGHK